jgi:hypothetical protein
MIAAAVHEGSGTTLSRIGRRIFTWLTSSIKPGIQALLLLGTAGR